MIVEEVQLYADVGGKTMFEVTPRDLGRNPQGIAEVSRRTGLHILMSTGRYREEFYEPELWKRTTADIAAEFIAELETGVDGIRAALIAELGANGYYVTPAEERIHRAAARAHLATGAPISTHSPCSDVGLAQLDIPITKKNLKVTRNTKEIVISAEYEQKIDLKVTTYTFRFDAEQKAPIF